MSTRSTLFSAVFFVGFAILSASKFEEDIDGELVESVEDNSLDLEVHATPMSSVESLVLNMIEKNGVEVCTSPFVQSVMKSKWRRGTENTPEEMASRLLLMTICHGEREHEGGVIPEAPSKTHLVKDWTGPPTIPDGQSPFEQEWSLLPVNNIRVRLMPEGPSAGSRGGPVFSELYAAPAPTPEEVNEINVILKNRDAECIPRKTPIRVPVDDPAVTLFPKCVLVDRCGGCCSHEALECAPTPDGIEKVTHKVVGLHGSKTFVKKIEVEQHKKCKCDCRVKAKDCTVKQNYEQKSCSCRCKKVSKCPKPQEWVEKLCQCTCPERLRKDCSTGMLYDTKKCKCVAPSEVTGPKVPRSSVNAPAPVR